MKVTLADTFSRQLENAARQFPDRIVFRQKTHDGYLEIPYREVYRQARGTALALADLGLRPGARAAIVSENRPEWVSAYLGILLAGCTVVPMDAQITALEWKRLIDDSDSQAVFVSRALLARLREVLEGTPLQGRVICFDPVEGDRDVRAEFGGLVDWGLQLSPPPPLPASRPRDIAVLIYTSGTTGHPKGVMLTQANIMAELSAVHDVVDVDESDRLLCLLPLHHVFASIINVLTPLSIGAQVTFIDTLRRAEILEALRVGGITILATVPQFFYLFYDQIREELARRPRLTQGLFRGMRLLNRLTWKWLGLNLGRLLFRPVHERFGERMRYFVCGGSAFDPVVIRFFTDLGFTVLQGYGLTETTGGCTITRLDNNVPGSVGTVLPGNEVRILDPDENGVGEILVRGPLVMSGYYRNPEATQEVIRDGWFHSGDLGRVGAMGNLFVTGRKKEVIVLPNGKNIYPDEIEAHYQQIPYIKEIAVLGIRPPDGLEFSERLHAVVVPDFDRFKAERIANIREVLRYEISRCSNQLPKYKRLMSYQLQKDALPRTTTRKIKRLELKRLIESGEMRVVESMAAAAGASRPEDQALLESAVGQEVLRCLRESYHRTQVEPGMNLELDLGFDSMERVELMASIEQSLNLQLPDDYGADIMTVRDLIASLERQQSPAGGASGGVRQSWKAILSEEALQREGDLGVHFVGSIITLVKYLGLRLVYLIARVLLRLEVRGLENLPAKAPYLICPNHQSYIDPFIVLCVVPYRIFKKVFLVGASEYFVSWHMKLFARLTDTIPVDPDANLLRAMKVGAYGLRKNRILCIFPEGMRTFDEGELTVFKKGAAILSRELNVPIVPVALQGAYKVWPRDTMRIRLSKLRLTFGAPIYPPERSARDPYQADTDDLKQAVAALLASITD